MINSSLAVSVVLPCRNEAAALPHVLRQITTVLATHHLTGEIIVSDSSVDASPAIARSFGAHVIQHNQDGYGRALRHGINAARAPVIFFADPDGTYDFSEIPRFVAELTTGADLVIGNRLHGTITPGAMPALHRYVGTPVLSYTLRSLFNLTVTDTQSGMRALTRELWQTMHLTSTGMEFASELLIAAARHRARIVELPINYHPRQGTSKLRPWRDALRHVRLMTHLATR